MERSKEIERGGEGRKKEGIVKDRKSVKKERGE